jgi:hypothetical protein
VNLYGLVAGLVGAINPNIPIILQQSNGYTTNPDGSRSPAYSSGVQIIGQVQPLTYTDLQKVDGLNIQDEKRKVYVSHAVNGVVRLSRDGGDLVTLPDGTIWKVAQVLEAWPDWTSFAIVLQNGS